MSSRSDVLTASGASPLPPDGARDDARPPVGGSASGRPDWRIVSPAPKTSALALAGARARVRRAVLRQVRTVDSVAIYRGDQEIAVAMFGRHGWRRTEMALAIAPEAARYMLRLVRIAQLTLFAMAETHLIVASIHPANAAGQRMAMLTGFRRSRLDQPGVWILRGKRHG